MGKNKFVLLHLLMENFMAFPTEGSMTSKLTSSKWNKTNFFSHQLILFLTKLILQPPEEGI